MLQPFALPGLCNKYPRVLGFLAWNNGRSSSPFYFLNMLFSLEGVLSDCDVQIAITTLFLFPLVQFRCFDSEDLTPVKLPD